MDWFRAWLDDAAPGDRPVALVGFSGGAAFAGGLVLDRTWGYVRDESGATAVARRDPVGHGIAAAAVPALAGWLQCPP
jgi:phospholipase/carboxylesterase